MPNIYLAGAHSRATTMAHYLTYLNPEIKLLAYLYDDDEVNPTEIDGVPVVKIDGNSILDTEATVYLGTRGVNHAHLTETLTKCGMKNIIPVDVKLDLDTRNEYLKKYYASIGREYLKIDDFSGASKFAAENSGRTATIYVAGSVFDKPLKNPEAYIPMPCEKILQVGCAVSDNHIQADYFDDAGENISDKNVQFCELTGLYWIWKHAREDIVGLVHYRRHFTMPDNWLEIMEENDIDVILPLPLYVHPSLEGNYKNRHIPHNWDIMMENLKKTHPDDYETAAAFFKETALYSPCNMFIARREVLKELGDWLFPVLWSTAKEGGVYDDRYQNRYPGFLSERLMTFFFEKNRDKYKVVYANKNFLE